MPWADGCGGRRRADQCDPGGGACDRARRRELVHHAPTPVRDRLEGVTGVDLSRVAERAVARPPATPRRRPGTPGYWRARAVLDAPLSAPYDLFVALAHEPPPFCHARSGSCASLSLRTQARAVAVEHAARERDGPRPSRRAAVLSCMGLAAADRRAHQVKLSDSRFTQQWTRRLWEVESEVVYPPVDRRFRSCRRRPRILSVGRFAATPVFSSRKQWCSPSGGSPAPRAAGTTSPRAASGCSRTPRLRAGPDRGGGRDRPSARQRVARTRSAVSTRDPASSRTPLGSTTTRRPAPGSASTFGADDRRGDGRGQRAGSHPQGGPARDRRSTASAAFLDRLEEARGLHPGPHSRRGPPRSHGGGRRLRAARFRHEVFHQDVLARVQPLL